MLRIKSDVDLKELEKFGFKKENFQYVINTCKNKMTELDGYAVDLDTRQIINYAVSNVTLNTLYDLITAGLVEKIEERN